MRTLNLGILAHVDAGKTSLTERLLYAAGVIDAVGSVDHGDTQTDTLALERERGITIKTAVATFTIGDVNVNLIDTPGHPDFIAEVDRVLALLDGAVLVVSAVEGVQAQTRILMRALQRLRIPTIVFVNKIDRMGADVQRVVAAIRTKLSPLVVPMGAVRLEGTREASFSVHGGADAEFVDDAMAAIAEHETELFAGYAAGGRQVGPAEVIERFAAASRRAIAYPVFCGSAITGAGIDALAEAVTTLLPVADGDEPGDARPPSGVVFKIDRAASGERAAIVRLFSGVLRTRDRVVVRGEPRRVTGIAVFEPGGTAIRPAAIGGQIARVSGLGNVRIGDAVGSAPANGEQHFSPPPFEAVVTPVRDTERGALRSALDALADEDPLINVKQDDGRGELSVSLYGDVQREVIRDTLERDFGVAVEFSATTVVCIERLAGIGEAEEVMLTGRTPHKPFLAALGLRVEPAPPGAGLAFSSGVQLGRLPLAFVNAVGETVRDALAQGLAGWEIPDCSVTMTSSGYWPRQSHAHGTFDKSMSSTAGDFRLLTPLVLLAAIRSAGTVVHEPLHRFLLEAPADVLGSLSRVLAGLQAVPEPPLQSRHSFVMQGTIRASCLRDLRQQLAGLTRGEGFFESSFDSYQPVRGPAPARSRTDLNPLDRTGYLRQVSRMI